jgi:hypothetical protein
MISTSQQQPVQRASTANAPNAPAWLKLEPGEELLASYRGKQIAEVVIYAVFGVLILGSVVLLIARAVGGSGHDIGGILTSLGGTASGLVLSLAQLKKTQLHVTNKMLIFAEGKKAAGVPLADITALKPADGSRWTIGIYAKGQVKPIGKITVLNPEQVQVELADYCRLGGAKLAADTTMRGSRR